MRIIQCFTADKDLLHRAITSRGPLRVEQELFVPAGAAWMRVAVRDLLTNRTGTLEVPLPLAGEPAVPAASAGQ